MEPTGTGGRGVGGTGAGQGGATGAGGVTGIGGATGTGGKTGPCDVWLAPSGVDTNPGTVDLPMLTLAAGYNRLCPGVGGAQPGNLCSGTLTTMCLKAGTYPMAARFQTKKERMGTPTRIITIMPDPAATTKPVLDFATQPRVTSCPNGTVSSSPISGTDQNNHGGIDVVSDYYKIQGLEIKNSNGWGISVQGAHDVIQDHGRARQRRLRHQHPLGLGVHRQRILRHHPELATPTTTPTPRAAAPTPTACAPKRAPAPATSSTAAAASPNKRAKVLPEASWAVTAPAQP